MIIFLGIPFSVPSVVIAIGMKARKRWTAHLAMIFDVFMGSALLAVAITSSIHYFVSDAFSTYSLPYTLYFTLLFNVTGPEPPIYRIIISEAVMILLPIAFLIEGTYLARMLRVNRAAIILYGSAAILILSIGLVPRVIESAHIKPVLSYCNANWFAVPRHAKTFVSNNRFNGQTEINATSAADFTSIGINARPQQNGKWLIESDRDPRQLASISSGSRDTDMHPPHSQDDAIGLLRKLGVNDPDLRLVSPIKVYNGTSTTWCFKSPKAKGTYVVTEGDGRVYLQLDHDIVLP